MARADVAAAAASLLIYAILGKTHSLGPFASEEILAYCCEPNSVLNRVIHKEGQTVQKITFYGLLQQDAVQDVEVTFTDGTTHRFGSEETTLVTISSLVLDAGEELPEVQLCTKDASMVSLNLLGKFMAASCWQSFIFSFPETDGRILTGVIGRFDESSGISDFGLLVAKKALESQG